MRAFTVETTTIDGVPVFWGDVDVPPTGALQFGVGRAHERAAASGITHLVEHLALAPLTQQDYQHNGFVTGTRTVFHANGSDAELTDYWGRVTEALGALPLERLGMERRILRHEGQDHSPGITGQMIWYRFGHQGHGLIGVKELGLGWLGPRPVQAWATTMFTRANAALWLSGPPPADLRLTLPEGERPTRVPLDTVPNVTFPAHIRWTARGVALSFIAPRGPEAMSALEQAARRVREILRFERGLVYDIHSDYEPLDGDTAHCILATDCDAERAEVVSREILRAYDDIAQHGLTDDELRRAVRGFHEREAHEQSRLGALDGAAFGHLTDRPYRTVEEIRASYEGMSRESTAKVLADASATLLLAAAGSPPPGHDWQPYPLWSPERVEGRTYGPPGLQLLARNKRKERLVVGPEGVTWLSGDGGQLTVRYADCVAYQHWEGEVRQLWGRDGFGIHIAAEAWKDGAAVVRQIDAAVPREMVACDEHGIDALEDPGDREDLQPAAERPVEGPGSVA